MDIFNEILWPQFRKLNHIKTLPLNEQTRKYNLYINELTYERNVYLHWLEGHKKGDRAAVVDTDTFFILQEDDSYILQEDGDKLIWN